MLINTSLNVHLKGHFVSSSQINRVFHINEWNEKTHLSSNLNQRNKTLKVFSHLITTQVSPQRKNTVPEN